MILTCPSCQTRYTVDPLKLGPSGRNVRCDNCGHTWHQAPVVETPTAFMASPVGVEDDFTLLARRSGGGAKSPTKPKTAAGPIGWVALIAVIVLGGAGIVAWRQEIVKLWPPSAKLYDTIGMPVRVVGEGLDLQEIQYVRNDETNTLVVQGSIVNISKQPREVPPLRAMITTATRQELKSWTFTTGVIVLLPGDKAAFKTELNDLPKGGSDLAVTFAEK